MVKLGLSSMKARGSKLAELIKRPEIGERRTGFQTHRLKKPVLPS